jgi:short-subunit dehydrogenase
MNLSDKKVIITGAASGIGQALLAQLLTTPNIQIIASDINPIAASYPEHVIKHQGNIADAQGIDELFDFAIKHMGQIDLFIANAGFAYYEQTEKEDWAHIERIYACNTFSPIYTSHKMARINEGREYGVMITASFMGIYSLPGYSLYSATKASLLSWADAYRREKDDQGHIMMLCPVATKTHFFDTTAPVPWPSQTSQQVASAAIKGINKNRHRIYPSKLSVLTLLLDWIFPLTMPIYKAIESFKFKQWLNTRLQKNA